MGQLVLPASGLVYVDTSAVIYAVEQIEPFYSAGLPLWDALNAGQQQIITSELTLLEVLVKPLRLGDQTLVALYRNILLTTAGLTCLPVTRSVLESAAQLRALLNFKTPDAIHSATATEMGSALFVTNDADFKRVVGLNVAVLGDIAVS